MPDFGNTVTYELTFIDSRIHAFIALYQYYRILCTAIKFNVPIPLVNQNISRATNIRTFGTFTRKQLAGNGNNLWAAAT